MKKTYNKWFTLTCIFVFISCCLGPSISGYVEKSSDLKIVNDEFDDIIEGWMAHGHFPGMGCAIIRNDTVLWSKGYGLANIGIGPFFKRNVTTETIFPMASISKSVAATAIMQLNETGRISLDENISKYLPFDLKNPRYPDNIITARMLLAHQSSIKNLGVLATAFYLYSNNDLKWTINHLKKKTSWFDYAPGENVCYASLDINILGYVIENITGMTYSDYVQENIFEPLKMYNTSFYLSDYNKNELVRQYVWFKGIYLRIPFIRLTKVIFPGGGVRSNIDDMTHFLIMHATNGTYDGVRILKESSVQEMHRAQYPETLDNGVYHGLGWYFKNYTENETIGGHSGTNFGAFSIMKLRYSDRVGILYFYNQHSYILGVLKKTPDFEKEAVAGIREALFEKADEL